MLKDNAEERVHLYVTEKGRRVHQYINTHIILLGSHIHVRVFRRLGCTH